MKEEGSKANSFQNKEVQGLGLTGRITKGHSAFFTFITQLENEPKQARVGFVWITDTCLDLLWHVHQSAVQMTV